MHIEAINKDTVKRVAICSLSGLVSSLPWYYSITSPILLVSLLCLFFVIEKEKLLYLKLLYTFALVFTWYQGSVLWILNTDFPFIISTIICAFQAVMLSIFLLPSLILSKNTTSYLSLLLFISGWLAFDKIYEYSEIANPVYTLGNGLGGMPSIIQWYEITGSIGGSFWVLLTNIVIYKSINSIKLKKLWIPHVIISLLLLAVPLSISYFLFNNQLSHAKDVEILLLHSNIKWSDKVKMPSKNEILNENLKITKENISDSTILIIWPETAIRDIGLVGSLNNNQYIEYIDNIISNCASFNYRSIILGAIVYDINLEDKYNIALSINKSFKEKDGIQYRSKEKLVPFVEAIPYNELLPKLSMNIKNQLPFSANFKRHKGIKSNFILDENINYTPFICYEICFGELIAESISDSTNFIVHISNEGRYINPLAAKQFLYLSQIRAIENRKYLVKSSNAGISSIINEKGHIVDSAIGSLSTISAKIPLLSSVTFFSKNASMIGKIIIFIYVFLLLIFTNGYLKIKL